MSIPASYMGSTKNLGAILDQLRRASVPPKLTYQQLKEFGYPSSNDRPLISILKAMGFLDDAGVPLDRYREFKDGSRWKQILAEGIRTGYSDVFGIDEKAFKLSKPEIDGIFARLSDKSESVTEKMAMTFRGLCGLADFSQRVETASPQIEDSVESQNDEPVPSDAHNTLALSLRHDIHLHLPVSDDVKVYDAIFQSLRSSLFS